MKGLFLLVPLLLAGCATSYQPEGATGGFADVMTGPDTAIVTFSGNGYTSAQRVLAMITLRCAELTVQHGYRYFAVTGLRDLGARSSFATPGYSTTNVYGNVSSYGGFTGSAYTTTLPSQTVNIYKPAAMVSIKMSNNLESLQSVGLELLGGQRLPPGDAAFISQKYRQQLGIKAH
jgi:hypothetical protein